MKGTSWRTVEFLVSHYGKIYHSTSEGVRPLIWLQRSHLRKENFELSFQQNPRWYATSFEPPCLRPGCRRKRSNDGWDSSWAAKRSVAQLRTVRAPLFPRYMFLILDLVATAGYRC